MYASRRMGSQRLTTNSSRAPDPKQHEAANRAFYLCMGLFSRFFGGGLRQDHAATSPMNRRPC